MSYVSREIRTRHVLAPSVPVEGTVQTWRDAVVRSRHEQQRPEKLGRRQSTTVYDGRSVMMMTLSEDDLTTIEPRNF